MVRWTPVRGRYEVQVPGEAKSVGLRPENLECNHHAAAERNGANACNEMDNRHTDLDRVMHEAMKEIDDNDPHLDDLEGILQEALTKMEQWQ